MRSFERKIIFWFDININIVECKFKKLYDDGYFANI